MHQGYELYAMDCSAQSEDPPVWYLLEGSLEPKTHAEHFTEWVEAQIRFHCSLSALAPWINDPKCTG
jgi:hypothetical protein